MTTFNPRRIVEQKIGDNQFTEEVCTPPSFNLTYSHTLRYSSTTTICNNFKPTFNYTSLQQGPPGTRQTQNNLHAFT